VQVCPPESPPTLLSDPPKHPHWCSSEAPQLVSAAMQYIASADAASLLPPNIPSQGAHVDLASDSRHAQRDGARAHRLLVRHAWLDGCAHAMPVRAPRFCPMCQHTKYAPPPGSP
jgi:hypothetical protein